MPCPFLGSPWVALRACAAKNISGKARAGCKTNLRADEVKGLGMP